MTKQFTKFDRQELSRARNELLNRFGAEAEKLGLRIDLGRFTYESTEFRCKLTVSIADADATEEVVSTPKGSIPEIGQKFRSQGKEFVVTGFNWNRPKYPISATRQPDGKRFKFELSVVR